jgi:hypothetical protein
MGNENLDTVSFIESNRIKSSASEQGVVFDIIDFTLAPFKVAASHLDQDLL